MSRGGSSRLSMCPLSNHGIPSWDGYRNEDGLEIYSLKMETLFTRRRLIRVFCRPTNAFARWPRANSFVCSLLQVYHTRDRLEI